MVQGKETDRLLRHEQGHLDITGLAASEATHRLTDLEASEWPELRRKISDLHRELQDAVEELQTAYDDQVYTPSGDDVAWDETCRSSGAARSRRRS